MSNPGSASRHACCVCLLLLLFAGGCSSPKQVAQGPMRVGTIMLAARSMPVERTLSGRTVAYEISEVRPQVGGVLRKRLFEEGQEVQQGQPLYEIDPAPYQAAYDTARGQLAQAEAAMAAARAAVRSARINLDYTRIVAPIAGHIGTSAFTAGALVTAEQDGNGRSPAGAGCAAVVVFGAAGSDFAATGGCGQSGDVVQGVGGWGGCAGG